MSIVGSEQWMYSSAAGFYDFPIEQSLRFNDDDSAYLSRTPASAGNRKTWTWSGWVKRSYIGATNGAGTGLFGAGTLGNNANFRALFDSDRIYLQETVQNVSNQLIWTSTPVFRDASAWYNIVIAMDTTQASSADRVKVYVNGTEISGSFSVTPSQNQDTSINNNTPQYIGASPYNSAALYHYHGYLADVNLIDGTALDASSFGETKSGIWIPKNTSGLTFGTNGFRLQFGDSAAIGDDTSGNTNDWTANNLVASDVLLDGVTNNFAVWSPIDTSGGTTFQEGNTEITFPSLFGATRSTFGVSSGKWYWEVRVNNNTSNHSIGILESSDPKSSYIGGSSLGYGYVATNGNKYNNATSTSYGATYTTGDIISVALDMDAGTITFYKNGSTQGQAFSGISGTYHPAISDVTNNSSGSNSTVNFGQDSTFAGNETAGGNADANGLGDFAHAPPSGFLSLCSANLPTGAIDTLDDETPEDYFNTVLYSATSGVAGSVTGYGFAPDWIWTKARNTAQSHQLFDNVRGDGVRLITNSTGAESDLGASYLSLEDDGFDYGTGTFTSNTYVGWGWKANGSGVSNTDGSITSTVSVGATSQQNWFSIVSYTGNATAGATVGHGLGVKPDLLIIRRRSPAEAWPVWVGGAGFSATEYLRLNGTNAKDTATSLFNSTLPTSSVFTIGTGNFVNTNTSNYICYAFANAEGLCKVGSYRGNGSTDGTFVFTGHRPAFLITKHVSSGNWAMWDNRRDPENVVDNLLYPNLSNAQNTGTDRFDFLSNGFKCKNTNDANAWNASGVEYVFLSIASQPFKFANAR